MIWTIKKCLMNHFAVMMRIFAPKLHLPRLVRFDSSFLFSEFVSVNCIFLRPLHLFLLINQLSVPNLHWKRIFNKNNLIWMNYLQSMHQFQVMMKILFVLVVRQNLLRFIFIYKFLCLLGAIF